MAINPDALWTRSLGATVITQCVLDRFGGYLKLTGMNDVLHDGCVDGYLTKNVIYPHIANYVKTILGTDRWQTTIDIANQENSSNKITYQAFDIMNATDQELDQMKNRFDYIFSVFVAEWKVPNSTLLEKYYKILKTNGQIFVVILADTPLHQSYYTMAEEPRWKNLLTATQIFENYTEEPVDYINSLVANAGFRTDVCEAQSTSMPFKDFPDVVDLVSRLYFDFWGNMSENEQNQFLKENLKNCLSHMTYSEETSTYDYPFKGVMCIATKR